RAPAAAEVEDPHAVGEPGTPAREREHHLPGDREVLDPRLPVRARVLQARPEEELEELRRQLVVLLVGAGRELGDRARAHARHERGEPLLLAFHAAALLAAQAPPRAGA